VTLLVCLVDLGRWEVVLMLSSQSCLVCIGRLLGLGVRAATGHRDLVVGLLTLANILVVGEGMLR